MRCLVLAAILTIGSAPASAARTDAPSIIPVQKRIEADETRTLAHEVLVPATSAEVWDAISTPDGWRQWAVPVAWNPAGKPDTIETSYDPAATAGSPGTIQQQIVATIPQRLLVFRTVKAPAAFPHWDAYRQVTSFFELEEEGPRLTRVRLTGAGYPPGEPGDAALKFFERGNAASLEWLRERFVSGPADWQKRLSSRK